MWRVPLINAEEVITVATKKKAFICFLHFVHYIKQHVLDFLTEKELQNKYIQRVSPIQHSVAQPCQIRKEAASGNLNV